MLWSRRRLLGPLMLAGAMAASPFLAGPASASTRIAAYGPGACSVAESISPQTPITAGSTITISLSGTCGNRSFTVSVPSAGITLGTITTGANGSGSGVFTIPASLAAGTYTIAVSDVVGNSGAIPIAVMAATPAAATPAAATPAASQSSQALPFTGTDATGLGAVGAGAIGIGGLIVLASRRRRAANFR